MTDTPPENPQAIPPAPDSPLTADPLTASPLTASPLTAFPLTIAQHFTRNVRRNPAGNALLVLQGSKVTAVSWSELAGRVCKRLDLLKHSGVNRGDRILLAGPNCLDWIVVDLAAQLLSAVTVPANPKLSETQRNQIREHSQPCLEIEVQQVANFESDVIGQQTVDVQRLQELADEIKQDDLCTIIYTSGTTGEPKGVMLSHGNFAANVAALLKSSPVEMSETRLCVLPLSHVFARTNDLYTCIAGGCCLALLDTPANFLNSLQVIRPTFFNAVPFLLEKICGALSDENLKPCPGTQRSSSRLGDSPGYEPSRTVAIAKTAGSGKKPGEISLRELLGGRIRAVNCGGAALPVEIENTFADNAIPLLAGYGLTETSPVITASSVGDHRPGHVGRAIKGVQIRLDETSNNSGEVLVRGPNVMLGYYRDPQATSRAIRDGWFHTGDIGQLNDGFLKIIGRGKEMIVTSTGYNIFPEPIEQRINQIDVVDRSCLIGDGLPCLIALVTLHESNRSVDRLKEQIAQTLADLATYQLVAELVILDEPFTIDSGTLTAKGSLRREVIQRLNLDRVRKIVHSMILIQKGKKSGKSDD